MVRCPSSRAVYQLRWSVYRSWCHSHGHSVSRPSLVKVADFLSWLRSTRGLSVSSIHGYRSMLSAVFRFHLPALSSDPVLRDLLRSFKLSSAERVLRPPAWDLSRVLRFLNSSHFEPLSQASFRALSQKTLFLLALATAKRVGELQALSFVVTFVGLDACLSYIPQFVAKSESLTRSIPRSLVKSLSDFAAGLDDDLLLCLVRTLRIYLDRTRSLSPLRHRLFVSPRRPSRAMSKNAVSFFLRDVIHAAGASRLEVGSVGPMRSAVSPPLSLSTGTGRFPRCLSPPLGAPVRCSHLFISAPFNTNMMACSLWVHSWLRVRGLVSPHLFLTCSGGGGGASRSLSPLLRVSCTFPVTGCVACPSCCWTGAPLFVFYCDLISRICVYFIYLYYACPSFKISCGVYALGTQDVTSDLVPSGFPSSHFQDSVSCLTCSHDSQLL